MLKTGDFVVWKISITPQNANSHSENSFWPIVTVSQQAG
jgi:hypothetical protein